MSPKLKGSMFVASILAAGMLLSAGAQEKDFDYLLLKDGKTFKGNILGNGVAQRSRAGENSKPEPFLGTWVNTEGLDNRRGSTVVVTANMELIRIDEIKMINFQEEKFDYLEDKDLIPDDLFLIIMKDGSNFRSEMPYVNIVKEKKKDYFTFKVDGKETKILKSELGRIYFPEGFVCVTEIKENKKGVFETFHTYKIIKVPEKQ